MLDCLIITSTSLRHKFFALELLKHFPSSMVVFENRDRVNYYNVQYEGEMKIHFDSLFKTEEDYFENIVSKEQKFIDSRTLTHIDKNEINSESFIKEIQKNKPRCIALYSVSIIREELISNYKNKLFNIHAGLSPYYRGTATNIWPIINKELEYIGMTIHHVNKGIDSGGLILQGRPKLDTSDNTHTMACKNTMLSAKLMIQVIEEYNSKNKVPNISQDLSKGKQYYFKDFTVDTVKSLNKLLEKNIVSEYMKKPKKIDILEW